MINLKQCTFIIPIRIESEDRMRNVITVLCYLLENFDTINFYTGNINEIAIIRKK